MLTASPISRTPEIMSQPASPRRSPQTTSPRRSPAKSRVMATRRRRARPASLRLGGNCADSSDSETEITTNKPSSGTRTPTQESFSLALRRKRTHGTAIPRSVAIKPSPSSSSSSTAMSRSPSMIPTPSEVIQRTPTTPLFFVPPHLLSADRPPLDRRGSAPVMPSQPSTTRLSPQRAPKLQRAMSAVGPSLPTYDFGVGGLPSSRSYESNLSLPRRASAFETHIFPPAPAPADDDTKLIHTVPYSLHLPGMATVMRGMPAAFDDCDTDARGGVQTAAELDILIANAIALGNREEAAALRTQQAALREAEEDLWRREGEWRGVQPQEWRLVRSEVEGRPSHNIFDASFTCAAPLAKHEGKGYQREVIPRITMGMVEGSEIEDEPETEGGGEFSDLSPTSTVDDWTKSPTSVQNARAEDLSSGDEDPHGVKYRAPLLPHPPASWLAQSIIAPMERINLAEMPAAVAV